MRVEAEREGPCVRGHTHVWVGLSKGVALGENSGPRRPQGGLGQSGKGPRNCGPEHDLWFVQQGPEYQVSLVSWKGEAVAVLVASEAWVCGEQGVVHQWEARRMLGISRLSRPTLDRSLWGDGTT